MKSTLCFSILLALAFPLLAETPNHLYGTWRAEDVPSKVGEVDIRVVFTRDKEADITAWSTLPLVGEVRESRGPFQVEDDRIVSESIDGGTSVGFSFEGGDLIIRYDDGKTIRFQKTED